LRGVISLSEPTVTPRYRAVLLKSVEGRLTADPLAHVRPVSPRSTDADPPTMDATTAVGVPVGVPSAEQAVKY
jgi:hypothetical protein